MKRKSIWLVVLIGCLLLAGCSKALVTEKAPNASKTKQALEKYPGENTIRDMYASMAERAKEYAPKVITLSNGLQVQRTPSEDSAGVYHTPGKSISYNTYYLNADNRGCTACHDDLSTTLKKMTYKHVDLTNKLGIEMSVQQCLDCHSYSPGYVTEENGFGTLIHGLHDKRNEGFTNAKGDCWSCHVATNDGKNMQQWDLVKHDLLRGIIDIPNVEGKIKIDQTKTVKASDMWFYNWMYYPEDYSRYGAEYAGAPLDPKVFDNWKITVKGQVNNPFTIKLKDLIAEGLSVHTTMTMQCTMNPSSGPLIANCKITGIPLKTLLTRAGVKPDATVLLPTSAGGFVEPLTMDFINKHDAYIVYEIDGQKLSHAHGYPVQLWVGSATAAECVKELSTIEITNKPAEDYYVYLGWQTKDGGYYNKPNVGIFDVKEGQIIPVNKPFTFSGYTSAYDQKVTRLEFSMDRGKTWTPFDINKDVNNDIWINWHFTFTPEQAGAYVLKIRAVTDAGLVSRTPAEVMVNAK